MTGFELAIPDSREVALPEIVEELELDVRARVRDVDDLGALVSPLESMNDLARALAGTRLAPYATAAARRIEWQVGRLLGPPPGQDHGATSPGNASPTSEAIPSPDDRYKFRLIGELDLEWDELEPWARSRARLVKIAKERKREPSNNYEIRRGDFREVLADIQPGSAALILTDPPYAGSYEEEYAALGAFAAEKLVRGGSLVCYVGQRTLPFALRRLAEHLDYFWCLALVQRGGIQQLRMGVRCGWKPVLWFTNGRRRGRENVYDVLAGSPPSKELHEWAQGVDEVMPVIEMLTDPGELVLDPFAGSGSFGVAASKLGRRLIGATL